MLKHKMSGLKYIYTPTNTKINSKYNYDGLEINEKIIESSASTSIALSRVVPSRTMRKMLFSNRKTTITLNNDLKMGSSNKTNKPSKRQHFKWVRRYPQLRRKGYKINSTVKLPIYSTTKVTNKNNIYNHKKSLNARNKYIHKSPDNYVASSNTNKLTTISVMWHVDTTPVVEFTDDFTSVTRKLVHKKIQSFPLEYRNKTFNVSHISHSTSRTKQFSVTTSYSIENKTTIAPPVPLTTPNATWKKLWARETVRVNVLNDNESQYYQKKDLYEETINIGNRKTMSLSLTPPIAVLWAYKLARAISEGN